MSESGTLVALDNWHAFGYGLVVSIYDKTGALIVGYALEDLYSPLQIGEITTSISSRWWRCGKARLGEEEGRNSLVIEESLGGRLLFDLASGRYRRNAGEGGC